ncbi:Asp23/Gls24 family envelope stress response protein [Candidatus Omnitrophota bacterium]
MREEKNDIGSVKIHNKVIASIASTATLEVEGVKGISSGLRENFLGSFSKKASVNGIKVQVNNNDEVQITIPITVHYGVNVPEIATKVQDSVRTAIDKMTNLSLKDINVEIQGIERG